MQKMTKNKIKTYPEFPEFYSDITYEHPCTFIKQQQ